MKHFLVFIYYFTIIKFKNNFKLKCSYYFTSLFSQFPLRIINMVIVMNEPKIEREKKKLKNHFIVTDNRSFFVATQYVHARWSKTYNFFYPNLYAHHISTRQLIFSIIFILRFNTLIQASRPRLCCVQNPSQAEHRKAPKTRAKFF